MSERPSDARPWAARILARLVAVWDDPANDSTTAVGDAVGPIVHEARDWVQEHAPRHEVDKARPWWRWHEDNPDVVAMRDDGVVLEQVTKTVAGVRVDGWRGPGWEMWAKPGDFVDHADALAAFDQAHPLLYSSRAPLCHE